MSPGVIFSLGRKASSTWSVIIWFFMPRVYTWITGRRPNDPKPPMAIVGFVILIMTYVGTSFLIGSSHSFR